MGPAPPASLIVAWLLACAGEPATLDDCASLGDEAARENCRLDRLRPLWQSGDRAAFDAGLAALSDPASRDLVRLRIAIDDPAGAALCEEVETAQGREKCDRILGRPHLRAPRRP